MKLLCYYILLYFLFISYENTHSQYYTSASLNTIHNNKSAYESDMYLDTVNTIYKIGLTNGELGSINAKSSKIIDSIILDNGYMHIYSNSFYDSIDLSAIAKQTNYGDIKHGFQAVDHNGWYLLDGRTISTLSASVQLNATSIGLATNLPDNRDRVLKYPAGGETIGDLGGNNSLQILPSNLPNINLIGVTSLGGNHSHVIDGMTHGQQTVLQGGETRLRTYNFGIGTINTRNNGDHSHTVTVSTGGGDVPYNTYQPFISVNSFIYLGE